MFFSGQTGFLVLQDVKPYSRTKEAMFNMCNIVFKSCVVSGLTKHQETVHHILTRDKQLLRPHPMGRYEVGFRFSGHW